MNFISCIVIKNLIIFRVQKIDRCVAQKCVNILLLEILSGITLKVT